MTRYAQVCLLDISDGGSRAAPLSLKATDSKYYEISISSSHPRREYQLTPAGSHHCIANRYQVTFVLDSLKWKSGKCNRNLCAEILSQMFAIPLSRRMMLRASIFQINQAVHPLPKEKSKSSELRRFSVYGIRVPTRPPRGKACTASTCLSTAAMPQASSPSNGLPFTRQLHDRMKKTRLVRMRRLRSGWKHLPRVVIDRP